MNIYQFIAETTQLIFDFVIDLKQHSTGVKCVLTGSRALNYYIGPDYLKSTTFDYDFTIYSSDGIDYSEQIGNLFVSYLNEHSQPILLKHQCNYYFSLEKSQYSNTYKILINNKPLIDISNASIQYKESMELYPPKVTSDGYYIQSFEWLIDNLITILKTRTSSNNHIWDKTIKKAKKHCDFIRKLYYLIIYIYTDV